VLCRARKLATSTSNCLRGDVLQVRFSCQWYKCTFSLVLVKGNVRVQWHHDDAIGTLDVANATSGNMRRIDSTLLKQRPELFDIISSVSCRPYLTSDGTNNTSGSPRVEVMESYTTVESFVQNKLSSLRR